MIAEHFGSGNVPQRGDTRRMLLVKDVNATIAGGGGGGGGGGITSGAGAPVAAPASSPALYIDENTGTLYQYFGGAWH